MRRTAIDRLHPTEDAAQALPIAVVRRALQPGVHCRESDLLGRYADAALSAAEHAALVRHLDACLACRAEEVLLRSFVYGGISAKERRPVRAIVRELRRRERLLFDARAAARPSIWHAPRSSSWRIALALTVVLLLTTRGHEFHRNSPLDLAGGSSGGGASRSLRVELVAPHGDQAMVPRRLEWRPLKGASRYRARLIEVDRHEIWSIETTATTVELPPPVRALVLPAKTLVWHVTAYDARHLPIGESPQERFRLD